MNIRTMLVEEESVHTISNPKSHTDRDNKENAAYHETKLKIIFLIVLLLSVGLLLGCYKYMGERHEKPK